MPPERKLKKDVVARTFQYDCDRFLRIQVSTRAERDEIQQKTGIKVPSLGKSTRVGIKLVREEGRRWEIGRYEELIGMYGSDQVAYRRNDDPTPDIGAREFVATDALAVLAQSSPPQAIIEGQFQVPDFTPELRRLARDHGLTWIEARPDILWIRPFTPGDAGRVVGTPAPTATHLIHVVDVKRAAEPSLRHFVEVTFYTLALAAALERAGLAGRYTVSAAGLIWPGTHDPLHFLSLYRDKVREGAPDPTGAALSETLIPVPFEVYRVHVHQFFEERLPRVLDHPIADAGWHVAPTCQLCPFLELCARQAVDVDDLSRVAWLTRGQKELLQEQGIRTVSALAAAIRTGSAGWQRATETSHQLRSDGPSLLARAESLHYDDLLGLPSLTPELVRALHDSKIRGALQLADAIRSNSVLWRRAVERNPALAVRRDILLREAESAFNGHQPVVVPDRSVALMPQYWDMGIFLTIHFDPGSGLTFAMGAERVYFRPGGGSTPDREEKLFVVTKGAGMSNDAERQRLVEFLTVLGRWMEEAHRFNQTLTAAERKVRGVRVHFFVWDSLELKQLRRMFLRHMDVITGHMELMARLFPPEGELQDPDAYRSHPGTVVKEVARLLAGVPVPHDYTLLEVANSFHPRVSVETGRRWQYRIPYGFFFPLTDQIPFERAYELWNDRPMLTHRDTGELYTTDEVLQGIRAALSTRLSALQHVVTALKRHHGAQLVLKKSPFSAQSSPTFRMRLPDQSRRLNALHLLDNTCREFEVRGILGLPVDEREARFHAIRGLRRASEEEYATEIAAARASRSRYRDPGRPLLVFTFSENSRDARIDEGDFALILSNEGVVIDPEERWRDVLGVTFADAVEIVQEYGVEADKARHAANAPLRTVLGVELASLCAVESPPHLILTPRFPKLFILAVSRGLVDLGHPLVLDEVHEDHETKQIAAVLKMVGGQAGPRRGSTAARTSGTAPARRATAPPSASSSPLPTP